MARRAGLTLVFLSAAAMWSHSSLADGAIAVGMPVANDPSRGFRHAQEVDQPDADTAASKAMSNCQAARNPKTGAACRLIGTFHNQCVAVAVNGDGANAYLPVIAAGWAIAPDTEAAISGALARCETMRKGRRQPCQIEGKVLCDGSAK